MIFYTWSGGLQLYAENRAWNFLIEICISVCGFTGRNFLPECDLHKVRTRGESPGGDIPGTSSAAVSRSRIEMDRSYWILVRETRLSFSLFTAVSGGRKRGSLSERDNFPSPGPSIMRVLEFVTRAKDKARRALESTIQTHGATRAKLAQTREDESLETRREDALVSRAAEPTSFSSKAKMN